MREALCLNYKVLINYVTFTNHYSSTSDSYFGLVNIRSNSCLMYRGRKFKRLHFLDSLQLFFFLIDLVEANCWSEILLIPCLQLRYWDHEGVKWSEEKSLSHVWLFATPWTVTHQASQSIGFSRHEYWIRLPFPSPGDLPNPGIEPGFPYCRQTLYHSSYQGSPNILQLQDWQK